MKTRHLHHLWAKLRAIKPWYFLVLALLSTVVCIFALRANNEQMLKLRDAVYSADKNNSDVLGSLHRLQAYVIAHMNTNLSGPNAVYPPIQLKYTYDRLVKAQSDNAAQANNNLYTNAQHYCEGQNATDFSGRNRVPCIESYVQAHNQQAQVVPDALYKFAFVSPKWSPDLAGWSLVIAVLSYLAFAVTLVADLWFRRKLKNN